MNNGSKEQLNSEWQRLLRNLGLPSDSSPPPSADEVSAMGAYTALMHALSHLSPIEEAAKVAKSAKARV